MVRYYPKSKVIENLSTEGNEYLLDGKPYSGKYYMTYDGAAFTGAGPQFGKNKKLKKIEVYLNAPGLNYDTDNPTSILSELPQKVKNQLLNNTNLLKGVDPKTDRVPGRPNSYYPQPTEADYKRGYIIRYFTKKENERGFIIEISDSEYKSILGGTADYDISVYQTCKILWKITGPLNSQRKSQYNVIPGIIDTNKRLTEEANKTFLGIVDYIGGDYIKFARPTA